MVVRPSTLPNHAPPDGDGHAEEPGCGDSPDRELSHAEAHPAATVAHGPGWEKRSRNRALTLVGALVLAFALPLLAFWLEHAHRMPIGLRDRPLVVVGLTAGLALAASVIGWRGASTLRRGIVAGLGLVALAGALVGGQWIHGRYVLPPSSASAGVGAPLPAGTLVDESGAAFPLSELRDRPTLLVWFRGSWCPYCRKQLAELGPVAREYGDRIRIVAVTSEAPPPLREMQRELGLPFHLLSDPLGLVMSRCELTHCVAILDSAGILRWGVVSGNWDRLAPIALAQAAASYPSQPSAGPRACPPGSAGPECKPLSPPPPEAPRPVAPLPKLLQAVIASCPLVSVDGLPPTCRIHGVCQTGEHEVDCSQSRAGVPCQCKTSTSTGDATSVPYDPGFCVGSDRATSTQERFAAAAEACGFPL